MGAAASLYLRYALELAIVLPAAPMCFVPARQLLRHPMSRVYPLSALVLVGFVLAGSALCEYFACPPEWVLYSSMPLLVALYSYVVDLDMARSLFCFLLSGTLCKLARVTACVLCAVQEAANPSNLQMPLTSLVALGLAVGLGLLFGRVLYRQLPELLANEDLGNWHPASLILTFVWVSLVWVSPRDYALLMTVRVRQIALLALGTTALTLLFLADIVYHMASSLTENGRLRQENGLLRMEELRYNELTAYMDSTRAMRHDFRQHLRVIHDLAADGQDDELVTYIEQLGEATGQGQARLCANRALDAVASYYQAEADEMGATIDWQLGLPEHTFVSDTEMCALLGNLVENALQAVGDLPQEQRCVHVSARMLSEAMLGMTVRNPCAGRVRLGRNGLPRRHRKGGHGIGLASVQATAHRYNGTMDIAADDGEFAVSLLMYDQAA